MQQITATIGALREVGRGPLTEFSRRRLTRLTADLVALRPDAVGEFDRYLAIRERSIELPWPTVAAQLYGRRVVVTGGSGCIGTELLSQVSLLHPVRVVSASVTPPHRRLPGVEYRELDMRDRQGVDELFARERPDVVFHLAAQRDPGLAERAVCQTAGTNAIGTRNVVEAAERAGAGRFVYASTGKALRPYTSDVYAESKRIGEWLVSRAAGAMACAAVRFTHVVDNSIVLHRLVDWCRTGSPVRLHATDAAFYVQSARESAQLMLCAATAPADGVFRLYAIRDLDWPVTLLDLALGAMARMRRTAPICITGYEPGYEERPYPGLFDPVYSGEASPLLNAFEAPRVEPAPSPNVDAVPVAPVDGPDVRQRLDRFAALCAYSTPDHRVRPRFDALAWALLDATVGATSRATLRRVARLTAPHRAAMTATHRRIDDIIRRHAGLSGAPVPARSRPRLTAVPAVGG